MKTDIINIFNLKHFFKVLKSNNSNITYILRKPSQILIQNIHLNWMKYVYSKTHKEIPVYLNRSLHTSNLNSNVFGYIEQDLPNYTSEDTILNHDLNNCNAINHTELKLDLIMPQQDAMQYFVKWQRYRKYWWSSISTTPSLFAVHDIKYEDNTANVDIVAQLPGEIWTVENIAINFEENATCSRLSCGMSLNNALKVLLLDGYTNSKEEYLRFHRKIAPYKISFALDLTEAENKATLKEIATLLYFKLISKNISTWLPDFTLPYDLQIKENLHLGVPYTAILNNDVLGNGIFRLMNSSTMLGEQVHVADFHKYAAIIFNKQ